MCSCHLLRPYAALDDMVVAATAQLSVFCTLAASMLLKQNTGDSPALDYALTVLLLLPLALSAASEAGAEQMLKLLNGLVPETFKLSSLGQRALEIVDTLLATIPAGHEGNVDKHDDLSPPQTAALMEEQAQPVSAGVELNLPPPSVLPPAMAPSSAPSQDLSGRLQGAIFAIFTPQPSPNSVEADSKRPAMAVEKEGSTGSRAVDATKLGDDLQA
jgi:hypothetical protein